MRIELKERYEEHVRIYFEKTRDAQIRQDASAEMQDSRRDMEDYRKSLKPGAASFGRTIYADGKYIEVPRSKQPAASRLRRISLRFV